MNAEIIYPREEYNVSKKTMDKFIQEYSINLEKQKEEMISFFNSPLCQRMVNDLVKTGEILNSENFSYFGQQFTEKMSWQDITDENIELFIYVMSDEHLLPLDKIIVSDDEYRSEIKIFRCGLYINILYGQGCSISITKAK